jgi:hypothetical protein
MCETPNACVAAAGVTEVNVEDDTVAWNPSSRGVSRYNFGSFETISNLPYEYTVLYCTRGL